MVNEQQIVKKLFEAEGPTTWFGTVEERKSRQRYRLTDNSGHIRYADCDPSSFYPKGAKVVVQDGRIVGSGELAGSHKVYEV